MRLVIAFVMVIFVAVGFVVWKQHHDADSTAYRDGYNIAVSTGADLSGTGAVSVSVACSSMAVTQKANGDNIGSWEQGCAAGLSKWQSSQIAASNKAANQRASLCQYFFSLPESQQVKDDPTGQIVLECDG